MLTRLNDLMKEMSIDKNQLATQAGIPKTIVYGWCQKGYESIRQPTLQKIVDYFNISMEYLVNDSITDK